MQTTATRIATVVGMTVVGMTVVLVSSAEAATRSRTQRGVSPCKRHNWEVSGGTVRLDGRPVPVTEPGVVIVVPPTWRTDGGAVAWVERIGTQRRLVVVPIVVPKGSDLQPLSWSIPAAAGPERIFWTARDRVIVGAGLLKPRAVASWSS